MNYSFSIIYIESLSRKWKKFVLSHWIALHYFFVFEIADCVRCYISTMFVMLFSFWTLLPTTIWFSGGFNINAKQSDNPFCTFFFFAFLSLSIVSINKLFYWIHNTNWKSRPKIMNFLLIWWNSHYHKIEFSFRLLKFHYIYFGFFSSIHFFVSMNAINNKTKYSNVVRDKCIDFNENSINLLFHAVNLSECFLTVFHSLFQLQFFLFNKSFNIFSHEY